MLTTAAAMQPQPEPAREGRRTILPYPGLRPFSEQDSRLFFGREQETATLLRILENQQLVVVHGSSGCGKSSLVRAGLLPVFRMDAAANSKRGHVVIVRPADEGGPMQSLARKLDSEIPLAPSRKRKVKVADPHSWSTILASSPNWRKDIGDRVAAGGGTLCILFDQFEEIFPANKSYAAQVQRIIEFLNSLGEASPEGTALGGRAISVVVTMRSDYLGNCAIWEGFAETVNRSQYLLPRLSAVGLLRAIHEPARLAGGQVNPQVAERLMCVVKSEMDGLPIVQHALSRAWHCSTLTRGSRHIDIDAMDAVGGAENALSDHADQVVRAATGSDPDLENVADWMFRSLSDLDTDARIIRRSITFEQLVREVGVEASMVERVLHPFRSSENSLIMPPSYEELHDKTVISVSHETLLRQWKRISEAAFDEHGRVSGLAFREVQDGMIWRALSVQAQQFAEDGTSILGPAATEQRLPWYREMAQRPGWIARHEMQTWSPTDGEVERRWQQVTNMMEASERNLENEKEKLQREQRLVQKLKRLQVAVISLALLIMTIGSVVGFQEWQKKAAAARAADAAAEASAHAKLEADDELAALTSASWRAQLDCSKRGLEGQQLQTCLVTQTNQYKEQTHDRIHKQRSAMWMAQRYCAGQSLQGQRQRDCLAAQARTYLRETEQPNLPESTLGGFVNNSGP